MLGTAQPKPARGTAKRQKAKRKRLESKQVKTVRAAVLSRDRCCVLAWLSKCGGELEWAHIGKHRRCHTRGQAPERRHTTAGSAMLCARHHDGYDAHKFDIEPFDAVKGMDGQFKVVIR